jgi:hypothetical protein
MPRTNFNIIEHYEDTEPALAEKWMRLLNKTYNEDKNMIGVKKMFYTLKARANSKRGDYPTRRFIEDFMNRQQRHQVFKTTKKKTDTISSVIVNRPNQLIQADYLYFWWSSNNVTDQRGDGPIDTETGAGGPDPEADTKLKAVDKLFKKSKITYRGAIVAVDAFSRRGYVVPIPGNIDSQKSKDAMIKILAEADKIYGDKYKPPRTIQTDKGSEYHNKFREYLNDLKDNTPKDKGFFYNHQYGMSGRSQSQGLVERLNGTLKRGTIRALGNDLRPGWIKTLQIVLKNYNSNYHSTIQMSPDSVATASEDEIKEIRERIVSKAVRQHNLDRGKYKVGDYVRIRIFKSKKLEGNFTDGNRTGSNREDLRRLVTDKMIKPRPAGAGLDADDFAGVYLIHDVRLGRSADNNTTTPGRATTYQIVAAWSKESTLRTLPSGQKQKRIDQEPISIKNNKAFEGKYPKAAFIRSFTKDSLSRVPQDKNGEPIVSLPTEEGEDRLLKIIREATDKDKKSKKYLDTVENMNQADRKQKYFLTSWAGYDEPEWVPESDIKKTAAYEKFRT